MIACYFGGDFASLVEGGYKQIGLLKAGDRVWSLSNDGKQLIEDEVMVMPHNAPLTPGFIDIYMHTFPLYLLNDIFVSSLFL